MFTLAASPDTERKPGCRRTPFGLMAMPVSPATLMLSLPLVPLTMTLSAWPSPLPEVEVDLGDARAGQVVEGDGVGPAAAADVDQLDAGGVEAGKERW